MRCCRGGLVNHMPSGTEPRCKHLGLEQAARRGGHATRSGCLSRLRRESRRLANWVEKEMIRKIYENWVPSARRRRRLLHNARRQFETCGYALDDLSDSQLEAAITCCKGRIEKATPLTGKAIYWTLRRISPGGYQLQQRKMKQARQTS